MTPKVLVFGTGSVGSVYSYILCRALGDSSVTTICRSNYAVALKDGLTINSGIFGQNLNCRPNVVRSVTEAVDKNLGPFDFILVCAKALPTTPTIASQLAPAVTPTTTAIALIQNGITIKPPYATAFPSNPILSCVTYLPVTQTSPAVFKHVEAEALHLGTFPSTAPPAHKSAAETLTSLIQLGGATAQHHSDIQSARWAKLLINAAWNPVCALSRSRDAQFMAASPPDAARFVEAVMVEMVAIANAAGYRELNRETVERQMGRARARSQPGIEPSMMADAMAGRRMEVDAIVGNAVRIADEKRVEVPLLKALLALISGLDASFARESR